MSEVTLVPGAERADPLIEEGFALQRAHRDRLAADPLVRRRQAWIAVCQLAQRLRDSNKGYAALWRGRDDPAAVPVLTKHLLQTHLDEFLSDRGITRATATAFLREPMRLGSRFDPEHLVFSSSGSTGEAIPVVYHLRDLGRTLESLRYWALREARRVLYIGLIDRHNGGNAWMYHLGGVLDVWLADVFADPVDLADVVARLQPDLVLTRPSILARLGAIAGAKSWPLPAARLLSVGEPLRRELAGEIRRTWGAAAHNSYSTVETGPLGFQDDPTSSTLRVYDDLQYVELLDETDRPIVTPGPPGRVVVTTLYRDVVPYLRYETGDVAYWRDDQLTRLSFPQRGRPATLSFDVGAGRATVSEAALCAVSVPGVRQYQVVQTGPRSVVVKFEPTDRRRPVEPVERDLLDRLRAVLAAHGCAEAVTLSGTAVPTIQPDPGSGKTKGVIPWRPPP